jgi:tRNA(Ser,Leu) C12 N-acetylase TAN1
MQTWNVVVTVNEGYYRQARDILESFGIVHKTEFFNVLVMEVADPLAAMKRLLVKMAEDPVAGAAIARFVPVSQTFFYKNIEEFEKKALTAIFLLTKDLGGKKFHVRMHRRGFKKRISSLDEETFLDRVLLEALKKRGAAGSISFTDPDAVIVIETVGQRAGMAIFSREELARYPFLHVD